MVFVARVFHSTSLLRRLEQVEEQLLVLLQTLILARLPTHIALGLFGLVIFGAQEAVG